MPSLNLNLSSTLKFLAVATAIAAGGSTFAAGSKIFVIGGKADDPFWSRVKKGADDAALVVKAGGGTVTWLGPQNYDNLGPDAAKLIRTALSQKPDAIVGPNWVPEAMDAAFKEVVAAGVPLIIYNAGGMEAAKRLGAQNYVGSDEYVAGMGGGEYFIKSGAKNVLCVNTQPGSTNQESRCKGLADGMAKGGGKGTQLPLPSSAFGNPTAVAQAVKAALQKDPSIDGLITIAAGDATSAATGISQAGLVKKVKLGTFDIDPTNLARIKDGTQLFCIDQQPYLQGYLAVSMLNGFVQYGLKIPTAPILTGPGIVDASNVAATMAGATAGAR
jgi:simple sugar transport system substrate-binding protein